jgi:hypothetical protein
MIAGAYDSLRRACGDAGAALLTEIFSLDRPRATTSAANRIHHRIARRTNQRLPATPAKTQMVWIAKIACCAVHKANRLKNPA